MISPSSFNLQPSFLSLKENKIAKKLRGSVHRIFQSPVVTPSTVATMSQETLVFLLLLPHLSSWPPFLSLPWLPFFSESVPKECSLTAVPGAGCQASAKKRGWWAWASCSSLSFHRPHCPGRWPHHHRKAFAENHPFRGQAMLVPSESVVWEQCPVPAFPPRCLLFLGWHFLFCCPSESLRKLKSC